MEGLDSTSVRALLKLSGGDLGKGTSPGARARSDAHTAITKKTRGPGAAKSKSSGSRFVEAWSTQYSNEKFLKSFNRRNN